MKKRIRIIIFIFLISIVIIAFFFYFGKVLESLKEGLFTRTLGDIRTVATAVEAYHADHGCYPSVDSIEELADILEGQYIKSLPKRDGNNNPIRYQSFRRNPDSPGSDAFCVASPGWDGLWEHWDLRHYSKMKTSNCDADVVLCSGFYLVRWPEWHQYR